VVGQVGDHRGGTIDAGPTAQGRKGRIDPLVEGARAHAAPKAGHTGLKWQKVHRGPVRGRKSSLAHARSMAPHTAAVRRSCPRTVCGVATAESTTGARSW